MNDWKQISMFDNQTQPLKITKKIKLIELFAGIGSQAMALRDLGANFDHHVVVEFDKYCINSYNAIHGTDFVPLDITKISGADLRIDEPEKYCYLMTYSFPCQDLSIAGKGKGMTKGSGTRSGLLWEVERLLNECENLPQVLLMENVPQVHSPKNMPDFKSWIETLSNLGYQSWWQDLNAREIGYPEPIPQNRKRCFMVSALGGGLHYEFPKPKPLTKTINDYLKQDADEKYYIRNSTTTRMLVELVESGELEKYE